MIQTAIMPRYRLCSWAQLHFYISFRSRTQRYYFNTSVSSLASCYFYSNLCVCSKLVSLCVCSKLVSLFVCSKSVHYCFWSIIFFISPMILYQLKVFSFLSQRTTAPIRNLPLHSISILSSFTSHPETSHNSSASWQQKTGNNVIPFLIN